MSVVMDFQLVWMVNGANIGAAPLQDELYEFSPPNFQIPDFNIGGWFNEDTNEGYNYADYTNNEYDKKYLSHNGKKVGSFQRC